MDNYNNLNFKKKECYRLIDKLPNDSKLFVLTALKSAEKWHRGQTRVDGHTPYVIHIYRVIILLFKEFKISDREVLAAGALHDVIEDCEINEKELLGKFGKNVTNMVKGESQNLLSSRKVYMEHLKDESINVKKIKLCDRIDNLRTVSRKTVWTNGKRVQYAIESEKFILPMSREVSFASYKKIKMLIQKFKTREKYKNIYKKLIANDKLVYQDTEAHKRK